MTALKIAKICEMHKTCEHCPITDIRCESVMNKINRRAGTSIKMNQIPELMELLEVDESKL